MQRRIPESEGDRIDKLKIERTRKEQQRNAEKEQNRLAKLERERIRKHQRRNEESAEDRLAHRGRNPSYPQRNVKNPENGI